MVSQPGFINSELFCHWLVHFKNHSRPIAENPVLLILDNHSPHRDLGAVNYCRENHIDLLSLPPHTSHKMQPLDIGFFGPLKCAYSHECDKWMINNPGKVITQLQVGKLFNAAYIAIANIEKAINSFKASGISLFNPDKFQDVDFALSLVTDMPRKQVAVEVHSVIEKSNIEGVEDQSPDILNLEVECEDGIVISSTPFRMVDTPHNMSFTVSDILPLSTVQKRPRRKSRAQESEILSSSPFKNKLEELEAGKE
ncbi:hypothetical protein ILUMI_20722 [Ignelater luminosus]|uniref:DDE-1 domain-containing protein n=1 Tax=Ignelater luminosus TaxID=2038154 RepID=A0A8K0CK62_IGNLU|nr:hypothetical protein ILUMI_20722 [Ignelater luminosus]